ncbi:carboxypeptidase-like regulatory domain-containing protein [Paucisalibacillus sp. EB02]|uniref:carboxypeptidase-like regulatory domain-containing protein n=1 Tax=Paucisalibacillus sp. EB02 TaxID=1347087 RepID=UPI0004B1D3DD|nr:carboxypeptidase-like regulatory domain-containing protein [Paucisalibacillus sp. EB02]
MKIRMKVKHLVFMIAGIMILIPLLTNVLFPRVELYLAEKKINAGNVEEKQEILELLRTTPIESKKWEMIQRYMIEDGVSGQYDIYVSPSFTIGGYSLEEQPIRFTPEEKIPYLEDYVKNGPVDWFLQSAASILSFIYQSEGNFNKAKDVLYETSQRFPLTESYLRDELLVERIRLAKNHGEYDEANQYIEELLGIVEEEHPDITAQIAQLRAEIILQQGDADLALDEVKNAIQDYEVEFEKEMKEIPESERDHYDSIENRVYYQSLKALERSLSLEKSAVKSITLAGKILRSDGTAMEGVGVFLRDKNNASRSVSPEDTFQVVTDHNGRFEFNGVVPNNYQITLGFFSNQISGWNWPVTLDEWIEVDGSEDITYDVVLQKLIEIEKPVNEQVIKDDVVHFEWEAVKGAAYYDIGFGFDIEGGSMSTGFIKDITDTEIAVPVEDIYNLNGGISIDEDGVVDPVSLLAYTNPDNRFHWNVTAYDKDGKLITKSNGHRLDDKAIGNLPFFYLKERDLTNADRLLLDYKAGKALDEYKKNYQNNPDDLHSLRMITRLIGVNEEDYRLTEKEETIPYLEELALKSPSGDTTLRLAMHYYDHSDWENFHKWFDLYLDMVNKLDSYDQSIYASALMKQGKHVEANKQFKEAMKKDGSNRFVGHWIANELYRMGLKEEVVHIARDYPYHLYGGEAGPNWLLLMNSIMKESKNHKDYEKELNNVLEMYFTNNKEALENWLNTTNKVNMKKLIEAIQKVH